LTAHLWAANAEMRPFKFRPSRLIHTSSPDVHHALRSLLRHSAQPVSVLTVSHPSPIGSSPQKFHGATLSSFTSISLHPHPLVAFAIRMPSRAADSMRMHKTSNNTPHIVINILAASQAHTAVQFSRADLYPDPFSAVPYHLTDEGIPVLSGCIGAVSCALVTSIPLDNHAFQQCAIWPSNIDYKGVGMDVGRTLEGISELFIARVIRVEPDAPSDSPQSNPEDMEEGVPLPLIYHRRQYSTLQHRGKSGCDVTTVIRGPSSH
jgi:flavin reductase (DIM6/NTAB) family NADH-FMN oxidoreductase RutF